MVDLDKDAFDPPPPPRRRPAGRRSGGAAASPGPSLPSRRRPRSPDLGGDFGPLLFLLAAVTPLAGAMFRIIDLIGLDGLTATRAVGPRLQLFGNAVNPLTGLLLAAAVVVAVITGSAHVRLLAGTAVAVAVLMAVVAVAVVVAAVRDESIFSRVNGAHVEVISYEIGSALVALGVVWLALWVLRRPVAA